MNARDSLCDAPEVAALSMAYSEVIREASALYEGDFFDSTPRGNRISVQIPEAQWQKLAAAICSITGGDVA